MRLIAKNAKKSLAQLAVLRKIPLKKGWVQELANWIGVEPNSVSTWSHRAPGIPEKQIKNIEARGYPRKKWYIEEEIGEEFTLGDQVAAEVTRGGVIVPEDTYKPAPEDIGIPGPDSRPPLYTMPGLNKFQGITTFDRRDKDYLDDVKQIMNSKETGIIAALKANIVQFREMVQDRQEMKELKEEVQRLKKSIASSPNPGKDGTGEA